MSAYGGGLSECRKAVSRQSCLPVRYGLRSSAAELPAELVKAWEGDVMRGSKYYLSIGAGILGAFLSSMTPGTANAFFSAPLVECTQVTKPSTLATCAASQDPLARGVATIDDEGNLDIVVMGAGSSEMYQAVFRSPDGAASFALGTLTTGAKGSGSISTNLLFSLGKVGAGSVVLTRNGDQYVTGIQVATSGSRNSGPDFHSQFSACKTVNVPAALSNCGTDSFKGGFVEVESDSGDLTIQINGAAANTTYSVVLRSPNANVELALGSVPTDSKGNGQVATNSAIAFGTIASGTVVAKNGSTDEAFGGFRVTQKPKPKPVAVSGLVRCIDVNDPAAINDQNSVCGTDSLSSGSAVINATGQLMVNISGAPASTKYEVFYRPIDTDGSLDKDTNIALTTDVNGNAKGSAPFAKSGQVGSGNFVVKGSGFDQFLSGFAVK